MNRLRAAMAAYQQASTELADAINQVVPPTSTGYLHVAEDWQVAWVHKGGESDVEIELALDPPEHAYEWRWVTRDRLDLLQRWLGCDRLKTFALERDKVRYIATWVKA